MTPAKCWVKDFAVQRQCHAPIFTEDSVIL